MHMVMVEPVDGRVCCVADLYEIHQNLGQTCFPNVEPWGTMCPLRASNHICMGCSSSLGLLLVPQASGGEKAWFL